MKLTIEIFAGGNHHEPTTEDVQKSIDALTRMIESKKVTGWDDLALIESRSILWGIKKQIYEQFMKQHANNCFHKELDMSKEEAIAIINKAENGAFGFTGRFWEAVHFLIAACEKPEPAPPQAVMPSGNKIDEIRAMEFNKQWKNARRMQWEHEYAESGIINHDDAYQLVKTVVDKIVHSITSQEGNKTRQYRKRLNQESRLDVAPS